MSNLTKEEIEKFASRKDVRRIAVENFLMSMSDEAFANYLNLDMDARLYKWNIATVKAIKDGIALNNRR